MRGGVVSGDGRRRAIRLLILPAAVLMQLCLGATYSWSVYVRALRDLTGLGQGLVQIPFTLFYFVFPATMLFSGMFLRRMGPRGCAVLGGLAFGGGWVVASLGQAHFGLTALGIGVLAGVGAGLAYVVPIATCIRWFPRHKGLVTGVAVAGFGGGAALVSQVGGAWIAGGQATPFDVFRAFGLVFLGVVAACGLVMENPPGAGGEDQRPAPPGRVIGHPAFRALYLAMFAGLAAGFAVNANLKDLSAAGGMRAGIAAVSLFALGNAAGRVGWGLVFDRMGSARSIQANLLAQAGLLVVGPWMVRTQGGFWTFALATGMCYGGVLVLYASSVAQIWGADQVGRVYGWLFSSNIPAAAAPMAAGFVYDLTGSFAPALWAVAALLVAAGLCARRAAGPAPVGPGGRPLR